MPSDGPSRTPRRAIAKSNSFSSLASRTPRARRPPGLNSRDRTTSSTSLVLLSQQRDTGSNSQNWESFKGILGPSTPDAREFSEEPSSYSHLELADDGHSRVSSMYSGHSPLRHTLVPPPEEESASSSSDEDDMIPWKSKVKRSGSRTDVSGASALPGVPKPRPAPETRRAKLDFARVYSLIAAPFAAVLSVLWIVASGAARLCAVPFSPLRALCPGFHFPTIPFHSLGRALGRALSPTPPSRLYKNVLKCVLAYYLASLFTYIPFLSELIGAPWDVDGPVRNAHVVATAAVYFNPAKRLGGMVEAVVLMLLGTLYASILCFGSMAMSTLLMDRGGHIEMAHVLVLVVWVAGGFSLLAYAKVTIGSPTFNTVCSLVSLMCSVIITKEGVNHLGSFQVYTILQTILIVLVGSSLSVLVCFLVWPQSATSRLQIELSKTLKSFATLLDILTNTFLLENGTKTTGEAQLKKAIDAHQASFTTLKASLSEARFEFFDLRLNASHSYSEAIASMTNLAQGLTGLRAGCSLQYEIATASADAPALRNKVAAHADFRDRVRPSMTRLTTSSTRLLLMLRATFVRLSAGTSTRQAIHADDIEHAYMSASALDATLAEFKESISLFKREHSKAMMVLYRSVISPAGGQNVGGNEGDDWGPLASAAAETARPVESGVVQGIDKDLLSGVATHLYPHPKESDSGISSRHTEKNPKHPENRPKNAHNAALFGDLAGGPPVASSSRPSTGTGTSTTYQLPDPPHQEPTLPNEYLLRMYYFCFDLEEWAYELCRLVDVFVDIRETEEAVEREKMNAEAQWGPLAPIRVLYFSLFKSRWRAITTDAPAPPPPPARPLTKTLRGWGRRVSNAFARFLAKASGKTISHKDIFPEINDGSRTSHSAPRTTLLENMKHSFWVFTWYLKQPNIRYALKTGIGASVLASAAFIPALRPHWLRWRGEWALISYMVILSPTIGATNFLALFRVIGTLLGALMGVVAYELFSEDPLLLALTGSLCSAPCFYVMIKTPSLGPSSRFLLLTYNLACLYSYNSREDGVSVYDVALHRALSVIFGVLYGLLINNYLWPYEARRELRKGLSVFLLNCAYYYECLVRCYSLPEETPRMYQAGVRLSSEDVSESTPLLLGTPEVDATTSHDKEVRLRTNFSKMEEYLQLALIKLSKLLDETRHEPRLKGRFPTQDYSDVLLHCQTILDLLTAIRTVTTRQMWQRPTVRRDYVIPVNAERREMVGNIMLYFALLASALTVKTPLPAYMPPVREARSRLVAGLCRLSVVKKRVVRGGSESLLYLAYVIQMADVIAELEDLGTTFQKLFGIIGGAHSCDEFNSMFVASVDDDASDSDSMRSETSV